MTFKETDSELTEIFKFKLAMTLKVNENVRNQEIIKWLYRAEKDPKIRRALKGEYNKRKPWLRNQRGEIAKLSARRIGLQLGVSTGYITKHYKDFVGMEA